MEAFTGLSGVAVPLVVPNVDTDQIIPARFLRVPRREGYAGFLFHDMRRGEDGELREEFPLNRAAFSGATVLVAGDNFGCGSSREGAVYALVDGGIRCVVAPSMGDIFFNNCFKNGVLPVRLRAEVVAGVQERLLGQPGLRVVVDLEGQTIVVGNDAPISFEVDPLRKACLLRGLDDIALTREFGGEIAEFEARRGREMGWLPV